MATLDEDDFSLIHALQIRPRASWTDLAAALGTSPATLSRRWERLRADGSAWVIGHPKVRGHDGANLAIAEISCVGGRAGTLAQELAAWPMIITIEEAARDFGLIVTAVGLGLGDMPKLLLDDLSALPGVLGVRAHHVARLHLDASSWRVGGLDHERAQAVARIPDHAGATSTPANPWAEPYAALTQALIRNGRSSAADIARQTGRPLSTTRRQLGQLLASEALTFRCEVAQGLTPLSIVVQTWCRVPVGDVAECVTRLRATPGVRQVVGLPGPTNLLISTWTRSAESAMLLHEHLQRDLAPLEVVESAIVLRQIKRLGWRLDDLGRSTGTLVPYPPSTDRTSHDGEPSRLQG
ncbi:Lrp/AsnC family transcriptional regulator [Nocardioides sp. NPDC058538]|uniref:Lrp/AsnC family transcriptional regulator n=1 Tax=Nocardioides sp. NPDC058538 TaxID=3346542 RepID=UPI00365912F2